MLTKEEHERRMALYCQGLNDTEIAKALYLTTPTVVYWRKINGLPSHRPRRKITPEIEQTLLRMYQDGASDRQMSRTVGLPTPTVYSWRQRKGLRANFVKGGKPIWSS